MLVFEMLVLWVDEVYLAPPLPLPLPLPLPRYIIPPPLLGYIIPPLIGC